MKTCTNCSTVKSFDQYSRKSSNRDGRRGECKTCEAEYRAKYYAENRERVIGHTAKYHAENPRIRWESDYRSRCRAYGVDPVIRSVTRAELIAYWGNGERCIYCDGPFEEIEHLIPVGMGGHHVVENVAPSCGPCNRVNIWSVRRKRASVAA